MPLDIPGDNVHIPKFSHLCVRGLLCGLLSTTTPQGLGILRDQAVFAFQDRVIFYNDPLQSQLLCIFVLGWIRKCAVCLLIAWPASVTSLLSSPPVFVSSAKFLSKDFFFFSGSLIIMQSKSAVFVGRKGPWDSPLQLVGS